MYAEIQDFPHYASLHPISSHEIQKIYDLNLGEKSLQIVELPSSPKHFHQNTEEDTPYCDDSPAEYLEPLSTVSGHKIDSVDINISTESTSVSQIVHNKYDHLKPLCAKSEETLVLTMDDKDIPSSTDSCSSDSVYRKYENLEPLSTIMCQNL